MCLWQGQRGMTQIPRETYFWEVCVCACVCAHESACVDVCWEIAEKNPARRHAVFTAVPVDFTRSFGRYGCAFTYMDTKIWKARTLSHFCFCVCYLLTFLHKLKCSIIIEADLICWVAGFQIHFTSELEERSQLQSSSIPRSARRRCMGGRLDTPIRVDSMMLWSKEGYLPPLLQLERNAAPRWWST